MRLKYIGLSGLSSEVDAPNTNMNGVLAAFSSGSWAGGCRLPHCPVTATAFSLMNALVLVTARAAS